MLCAWSCSRGASAAKTDPDPKPEQEEEESLLVIKAGADLSALPSFVEEKYTQCSAAGVYILNEDETSYYNVSFASDGEGNFLQPESKSLYFDSQSEIYACLPYVKDATKSLSRDVYFDKETAFGDFPEEIVFVGTPCVPFGNEAEVEFFPIASVLCLKISNSFGKDIAVASVQLAFDTSVSGSFSCRLDKDPSKSSYAVEARSTLAYSTVSLNCDKTIGNGSSISCPVVLAPTKPSEVTITLLTQDGDRFSQTLSLSGLGIGGSADAAIVLSEDNYSFDLDALLVSMNLFDTDPQIPSRFASRIRTVDHVANVRDLGGIELENGKTTAFGVLYRSAQLDDIKQAGIDYMLGTMGIKTDLDLRNPGGDMSITSSPLGADVRFFNYSSPWYVVGIDGIKEGDKRGNLLSDLHVLADKHNYPVDFHCAVGRDRTGTLAFLVEALAGATKKALFEDYFISFYFIKDVSVSTQRPSIEAMYEFISTYTSAELSLSENASNFLSDLGLLQEEIDAIREIITTGDITVTDVEVSQMTGGGIEAISGGGLE